MRGYPSSDQRQFAERRILQDISNTRGHGNITRQWSKEWPGSKGNIWISESLCPDAPDNDGVIEWRINKQELPMSSPSSPSIQDSRCSGNIATPQPAQPKSCVDDIIGFIDQVGNILDKSSHDQSTVEELLAFMDQAADKIKVAIHAHFALPSTKSRERLFLS